MVLDLLDKDKINPKIGPVCLKGYFFDTPGIPDESKERPSVWKTTPP